MRVLALLGFSIAASLALGAAEASTSATAGPLLSSAHALRWCTNNVHDYAVDVTIVNRGSATSPQRFDVPTLSVHDSATPIRWSGASGLPAIRRNHSGNVTIALTPRAGVAVPPTLPLVVKLDRGRLEGASQSGPTREFSVAKWPPGAVVCRSPKAFARQARSAKVSGHTPPPSTIPQRVSAASIVTAPHVHIIPPVVIPQPKDLTYTTNPKTCAQHAGLLVAILCPDIINRGGTILLVWRWDAKIPIDGFYVYRTSTQVHFGRPGHRGKSVVTKRTLVDTQTDASLTIRAIKPFKKGECFIVVAYRGKIQSDPSNRFCVGATAFINTPMGLQQFDDCHSVTKGSPKLYRQCQRYAHPSGCATGCVSLLYMLTWSWSPCAAAGCISDIDGYNAYFFNKRQGDSMQRDFTQNDPALRVVPFYHLMLGDCFEVTAFKGRTESQASNPYCVTVAPPTPRPPPTSRPPTSGGWPSHVDYHITADSYPYNIDVQNGGSVTFYNDDTDNHTVSTCDPGGFGCMEAPIDINDYLAPGQSYTLNLPTRLLVGYGYKMSSYKLYYFCIFHGESDPGYAGPGFNPAFYNSMEGIITVHL